jgi:HD-GYP domain-containing protein (c-di-GMP phosphodiesterase class II)
LPARILVVADIYDALAAKRPYRDALPPETVFAIMQKDAPQALDASCLEALIYSCGVANSSALDLLRLSPALQAKDFQAKHVPAGVQTGASLAIA